MNEVEQQIADLERKLLLKKAYLAAKVSFGQAGKGFPEDVKKEVVESLVGFAKDKATENTSELSPVAPGFTEEETKALKVLAATVLNKTATTTTKPTPPPTIPAIAETTTPQNFEVVPESNPSSGYVTLMFLDNVDHTIRHKVAPHSRCIVMERREHQLFVEDPKGNRFWVPAEDVV